MGFHVAPMLLLSEVSGLSACAPSALATGSVTGNVLFSNGTPLTKFVEVALNHCCAKCGARNPVLTDARIANGFVIANRVASFPVLLLPKSL